ncbi:glycerophosphodiester phosphodiesterase [Trichuris trichiura]|uniref:Glycerophosphodiester phosphodiesterase n=1 Tax=Trichuris trichiura TaxID=36087 RepID=A0A077Z3H3_TRITR|nr:glycerophosphodiester phosphodiesterase [Trichuris trichiura]
MFMLRDYTVGGGEAHENTLNAVLRSACNGADMVELDCQLTADGKVVVAHEDHLLRVAGVNEYISNLPYKKLPIMKKQVVSETDPEVKSPETQNVEERRIPLLEEIFQSLRYLPINIDIKQNEELLIKEVNRMVIEYEREESTVWGNEDETINKKLYELNPKVHMFFSAKRVIRLLFLFYTGLLPFVPMRERFLEIPMLTAVSSYPEVRKKFGIFANLIMKLGDALLLSPALFDHLNRRKMHVFLWVLNEDDQFKRAFELGATAVMTDYPTKLAEYLLHHPPKEPVEFPRLEVVAEGIEIAKKEVEAVAEGLEIAKKEVKNLCP